MFCTVEANYEASRGLFATAELLVSVRSHETRCLRQWSQKSNGNMPEGVRSGGRILKPSHISRATEHRARAHALTAVPRFTQPYPPLEGTMSIGFRAE